MKLIISILFGIMFYNCLLDYKINKVKNSNNSYLSFIFPKNDEENILFKRKEGVFQLFIQIYDENLDYYFIPLYQSINPVGSNWLFDYRCYSNDFYIYHEMMKYSKDKVPNYLFVYNIEYMIKVPVGKNKFRFQILEDDKRYQGYIKYDKDLEFKPNQILRINLSKIEDKEEVITYSNSSFNPCSLKK
ncbi:hypothetical protein EHQ92_17995 [Leptospira biflexa]|uniref:hypothetical protein n=1 Tax=Leptospira biflexa TaxID=172 RepID=UPI0010910E47|nr:hypothetical protein [Leptospira biflexa]TGM41690.1 hypothetical protein EHQ92_17995 [Leptospira biflexa]TGM43897.1 hypothetical protein EHQ88_18165 [Leptospira biflexa]